MTEQSKLSALEEAENILTREIFSERTFAGNGIDSILCRFAQILNNEDVAHLSVISEKINAYIKKGARESARAQIVQKLIAK